MGGRRRAWRKSAAAAGLQRLPLLPPTLVDPGHVEQEPQGPPPAKALRMPPGNLQNLYLKAKASNYETRTSNSTFTWATTSSPECQNMPGLMPKAQIVKSPEAKPIVQNQFGKWETRPCIRRRLGDRLELPRRRGADVRRCAAGRRLAGGPAWR